MTNIKRTIEIGLTGEKVPQLFVDFIVWRNMIATPTYLSQGTRKSEHRQNLADIDDSLPWMQDWIVNGRLPDGRYIKQ